MKKIGLLIFAAALVIGVVVANTFSFGSPSKGLFSFSFNFRGVQGSGQTATDAREVRDFKGIDVGGVFKVEVASQADYGVTVEGDDNLLQYVKTEVRGGTLHITTTRKIKPTSAIRVRVSAPTIDNLDVSGAAEVTVNNIRSEKLTVDSSGASKIYINGEATKLNLDVSGATKIDAERLTVADANIDASGASSVTVNVTGSLNGEASGASRILYTGSPTSVKKDTSGAGTVAQK
jgi:hypothetical protein